MNKTIYAESSRTLNKLSESALKKILTEIEGRTGMAQNVIFDLLADGWVYNETIEGVSWTRKFQ